jgi:multidrug resistance efflux pump
MIMHFRGKPQGKTGLNMDASGRKGRLTRMAGVSMLGGAFMYTAVMPPMNMTMEGMVQGDLVPVAPMFRAQVTKTLATCYSTVKVDEPLAIINNFMLDEQYSSDYQSRQGSLRLEQINQNEGIAAAARDVDVAWQHHLAATATADKLRNLSRSYDELHEAGAIGVGARDAALADWMRATAEAAASRSVWQKAKLALEQARKGSAEKVDSLEKQIALLDQTRQRVSQQPLRSPAAGQVIGCSAKPNAVVEAGTPIYQVFDTDRAYVMVFADPDEAASLKVGMPAYIDIPGIGDTLPGHIAAMTMEAASLPEPLTRYFWQHDQWSQYRPIKITLDNLDTLKPELRQKLIFNAKVKARIPVSSWGEWLGVKA